MKLERLFTPITINGMTLKNRAVMPAMGTGYGNPDGTISDRLIAYLARRAQGGTGLIITEICAVDPRGKAFPNQIGAWSDSFLPGLTGLAAAIHREGGKIALQLHHAGRETFEQAAGAVPEAPSAIPSAVLGQPCEAMSSERIADVIGAFAGAAARAKKAGFDAVEIHAAGADVIHCSVGVYSTPGNLSIASMDTAEGFNLFRARAVKEAAGAPVIGVGRINRPETAEQALAAGDADLISFGRPHLTDPDFIAKAEAGDFTEIRRCVACNQGCIERLSFEMKSVTCTFNPACGREYLGAPVPVAQSKRLWVIGAGPAGLSAALAAAGRGYEVEIFEKEASPGGQLRSASRPPHKEIYWDWAAWCIRQLEKRDVKIRCGEEWTAESLREGKPDAVILAAGADPATPDIPGLASPHVRDARELLLEGAMAEGPTVILGGGYVGMETADFLIARGVGVTLLEMLPASPVGKHTAHGYWLHKRIRDAGGRMILGATVTRVEPDEVVYRQAGEEKRVSAALVVTAMGARPANGLEETLKKLGIPWRTVGDARQPRRLLEAIHEGDRAGREI